jgi:glucose-1-phosphate cytidylyltransferase
LKVVLLAGGFGTRISEETSLKPKPMVEIGGKPILWHIMKTYSAYGLNEFIVCCGYKGYVIKEFFANYFLHTSDVTFDMKENKMLTHQSHSEPWKVTLVDTGDETMTGGRIKRIKRYIGNETFCLTYGDGISNINIHQLIEFHRTQGKLATLAAVRPPGRFGVLNFAENESLITAFQEKPSGDGGFINGGFFVLEPTIFNYIKDDTTVWEREPLEKLASENQLCAYVHDGFWQPMDTLRDRNKLEKLWRLRQAPWKVW